MVVNLQRCWTEFTVFEADEEDKQILLKFKTISRLSRTENQRKTATIILYTKKQNQANNYFSFEFSFYITIYIEHGIELTVFIRATNRERLLK
jgi:hypothetical protein